MALESIQASQLLDLEGAEIPSSARSPSFSETFHLESLQQNVWPIWQRGRVIGFGNALQQVVGGNLEAISLPLELISKSLQIHLQPAPVGGHAVNTGIGVYIIAPHTSQAIPLLHALLAKQLADSMVALEMLRSVQVLQFFDLAGLIESVAEVSEALYQSDRFTTRPTSNQPFVRSLVYIQGISETTAAAQRRSGPTHANALLAGLARNITNISRMSGEVLVLVDAQISIAPHLQPNRGESVSHIGKPGIKLESSFCGWEDECLRLVCGGESLSKTFEGMLDCLVIKHDGFARTVDRDRGKSEYQWIVEIVKDRVGDMSGIWGLWNPQHR